MTTERLLQAILDELRALRSDLARRSGEPILDKTTGPFLSDGGIIYQASDFELSEQSEQGND